MRLLVTGGAGFIGANFVQGAVGEHDVTVLDALTYAGSRESLAPVENDAEQTLDVWPHLRFGRP